MIVPITLEDLVVRLEPLTPAHEADLARAAADGELWNLWYTSVPRPENVASYIAAALDAQEAGYEQPFAIRRLDTGVIVGTTRYMHIEPSHRRLEIGSTWIAKSSQSTTVNPACKRLLLEHAFTTMNVNRVEFLTHSKNAQSRAALTKLGATQEGILREHRVMPDGTFRSSVVSASLRPTGPPSERRWTRDSTMPNAPFTRSGIYWSRGCSGHRT